MCTEQLLAWLVLQHLVTNSGMGESFPAPYWVSCILSNSLNGPVTIY